MICPYCGRKQKDEHARFCSGCGKRILPPSSGAEKQPPAPQDNTRVYKREAGKLLDTPPEGPLQAPAEHTAGKNTPPPAPPAEKQQTLFMQAGPPAWEEDEEGEGRERASQPYDGTGHFYVDAHSRARPGNKKARGANKALPLLLAGLGFVVFLCGFTGLFLWLRNTPENAVEGFAQAIRSGDWDMLENYALIQVENSENYNREILMNTLQNSVEWEQELLLDGVSAQFPAISLQKEPLLLVFYRYWVQVEGGSLFIRNLPENSRVLFNGEEATGVAAEDGLLYAGLMPGEYTCQIYVPGENGETLLYSGVFTAADPLNPAYLELPEPEPEPEPVVVTVENCLSDEAEIYIDNVFANLSPVNGVLTLTDPQPGSVIKIVIVHENYTQEASVTYTGPENTLLRFENYVGEPPPTPEPSPDPSLPDPEQDPVGYAQALGIEAVTELLGRFYTAYLDCVNAQDIGLMQYSTALMNESLLPRLSLSGNLVNSFVFKQVVCAEGSYHATQEDGKPALLINASFTYDYRLKTSDGAYAAGGNKSSLQLLYVDGQWLVNRMVSISDEQYANNQFGDFSATNPAA